MVRRGSGTGPAPNDRIHAAKRDYALSLIRESYADFGPTLAAKRLRDDHGLMVSRETLRKWMVEDGLWLSREQRRAFHQPRLRRECFGELIQIDGSEHRWFEYRSPSWQEKSDIVLEGIRLRPIFLLPYDRRRERHRVRCDARRAPHAVRRSRHR